MRHLQAHFDLIASQSKAPKAMESKKKQSFTDWKIL